MDRDSKSHVNPLPCEPMFTNRPFKRISKDVSKVRNRLPPGLSYAKVDLIAIGVCTDLQQVRIM